MLKYSQAITDALGDINEMAPPESEERDKLIKYCNEISGAYNGAPFSFIPTYVRCLDSVESIIDCTNDSDDNYQCGEFNGWAYVYQDDNDDGYTTAKLLLETANKILNPPQKSPEEIEKEKISKTMEALDCSEKLAKYMWELEARLKRIESKIGE